MMKTLISQLVFLLAVTINAVPSESERGISTSGKILTSGYSTEIASYNLDDGVLSRVQSWAVEPNLTWLEQVGDSFYAIHEVGDFNGTPGGVISRWQLDNEQLVMREEVNLQSVYPAHLLIDTDHNLAFTANYGGSSVTVVSMDNGVLKDVVQVLQYGGPGCRDNSHPHQIVRRDDMVWVIDLGCDKIYVYKVVGNQLSQFAETSVTTGFGPRHMVLNGDLAIVACELESHVLVYNINPDTGLELKQDLDFASIADNKGAEIAVHNGFVYASSRGVGVIVVYAIDANNNLTRIQEFELAGTWPRSFTIKDDIMVVADKIGEALQIVKIATSSGMLSAGGVIEAPPQPAFVMFYD